MPLGQGMAQMAAPEVLFLLVTSGPLFANVLLSGLKS